MAPPTTRSLRRLSASKEFLGVWIDSATAIGGPVTLSSQPVYIAVLPEREEPDDDTTWIAATWYGTPGTARSAAIMTGPGSGTVIAAGGWYVYARVTDNPEIPVVFAGRLTVT